MTEFVMITTATGSRDSARTMAETLVAAGLAACVHILPVESCYRWNGRLQHDSEHVLQIKTSAARAPEVQSCIASLHSYELPEIVVTPILGGSEPYLGWMRDQLAAAE